MMYRLLAAFRPARRPHSSAKQNGPPRLEPLEDRTLLSVSSLAGSFAADLLHDVGVRPAVLAGVTPPAGVGATDPRFAGVGSVLVQTTHGDFLGTGTLVDPTHFVTAAHVLDVDNNGTTGEVLSVTFNLPGGSLTAQKWIVNGGWTGFGHPSVNDDLAVLTLSAPAPASVPTYPLFTGDLRGQTLTLVGYGLTGTSAGYAAGSASVNVAHVGQNVAGVVGNYAPLGIAAQDDPGGPAANEVWVGDFDGPSGDVLGDGPSLGAGVETTLGPGDSGGPGFVDVGGQLQLASVNTFTTSDAPAFGSLLGGMNVAAYASWIQSVVNSDPAPTDPAPIVAPAGLQATAGDGSVALAWTAGVGPGVVGYNVFRSTAGGDFVRINSSPLTASSFTDTGLVNGVTYSYVVRAVDASGNESGPSNAASATPRGVPAPVASSASLSSVTALLAAPPTSIAPSAATGGGAGVGLPTGPSGASALSPTQTPTGAFTLTATPNPQPVLSASALVGGGDDQPAEEAPASPQVQPAVGPMKEPQAPPTERPPAVNPWHFFLPKASSGSRPEAAPEGAGTSEEAVDAYGTSSERRNDLTFAALAIGLAGSFGLERSPGRSRPGPKARRAQTEA
jgi:hypothetical protein